MKDKTKFFTNDRGESYTDLKEKIDYFHWYFPMVAEDMDEAGNDLTADDYRAAVELVKELTALVSEDDLTKKYNS